MKRVKEFFVTVASIPFVIPATLLVVFCLLACEFLPRAAKRRLGIDGWPFN